MVFSSKAVLENIYISEFMPTLKLKGTLTSRYARP